MVGQVKGSSRNDFARSGSGICRCRLILIWLVVEASRNRGKYPSKTLEANGITINPVLTAVLSSTRNPRKLRLLAGPPQPSQRNDEARSSIVAVMYCKEN